MSVNIFRYSRKDKKGRRALYLRVQSKDGIFIKPLKISLLNTEWDSNKKRVLPTHPLHIEFNEHIDEIKRTAYRSHDLYKAGIITFAKMRSQILLSNNEGDVESLLETLKKLKTPQTFNNYSRAYKTFKDYLGRGFTFKDIDYSNLSGFSQYLIQKYKPQTANFYIKCLGTILREGNSRGLTDNDWKPINSYFHKVSEIVIETISKNEFRQGINKANTLETIEGLIAYLLSYTCCGAYYDDINNLNATEDWFSYTRSKTGVKSFVNGLDGLVMSMSQIFENNPLRSSSDKRLKSIKETLGTTFKTARKTLQSEAVAIGIDYDVRFRLLAHQQAGIKRSYTNFEMQGIRTKILDAQERLAESFGVLESAMVLLEKRTALINGDDFRSVIAKTDAVEESI